MGYNIIKIETPFDLPYKLIHISNENYSFSLSFLAFDQDQSDYSIQQGGVTGKFSVSFLEKGINADFVCDLTVGNIYSFYNELRQCYKELEGSAKLCDYTGESTYIEILFKKQGHIHVVGFVKNKHYGAVGTIKFNFTCDQSFLSESIRHLAYFFDELAKLQGYYDFKY